MSNFKSYKINDNNLVLEEYMYWTFSANQQDAVQIWTLKNVDKGDLNISRLDSLMKYEEDAESKIEIINEKNVLTISTWSDGEKYIFCCDNVSKSKRPYNIEELTEMLIISEKTYQKQSSIILKQRHFVEKLIKFVDNEIEKKVSIMNETHEHNRANIKANYQHDLLSQIKVFIDNQLSENIEN